MTYSLVRKAALVAISAGTAALLTSYSSTIAAESDGGPDEDQAIGMTTNFGKFTGGNVTWVYNPTGAPAGWTNNSQTVAAFTEAINEWAGICDLNFVYGGVDAAADWTVNDGIVVFAWDNLGGAAGIGGQTNSSTTATTLGRWDYTDGALRMDIGTFNFPGGTPAQQAQNFISFHAVAVHEIGHVIGLGHSDEPDSIMFANPYNSIRHITDDDAQGCRSIYGYSDVYDPREPYSPPTSPTTNNYSIILTRDFTQNPIPLIDDGTEPDSTPIYVFWLVTAPSAADTVDQIVTDSDGYTSAVTSDTSSGAQGTGGWMSVTSYGLVRENPGVWTFHVADSTGTIGALTLDVQVPLPAINEPPDSSFSVTETPNDRQVAVNVDVTNDTVGDNASLIWHVPGTSPQTQVLGNAYPYNGNQRNVTFNDSAEHEIFVEVNDDDARYVPAGTGNLGAPGDGFQTLHRYYTNDLRSRVDQDGNGNADILWRETVTGQNWLYEMTGSFVSLSRAINVVAGAGWTIAGTGDFNQDGKTDIVWRNTSNGQNWMYQMDGESIVNDGPINVVSDQNWQIVGTGDYDGDNNADILWRNSATGQLWMYLMKGTLVDQSLPVNIVSDSQWVIVASGDFNRDGKSDILWRNSVTGANWMYLMNGATIASSSSVNVVANLDWIVAGAGDFNNDGYADILWRNTSNGQNWMYLMNGATVSSSLPVNVVSNTNWQVAGTDDYDNDGDSDILWREVASGQNWMYLMDGNLIDQSSHVSWVSNLNWTIVNKQ